MKKYIIILLCFVSTANTYGQARFVVVNDSLLKKTLAVLETVINKSQYIIESNFAIGSDYYYIVEDNQLYFRTFIKVKNVLRGTDISEGDTIVAIWKQYGKGNRPTELPAEDIALPAPWSQQKTESCLFLIENTFPNESNPDKWSNFKKVNFLHCESGYPSAHYDTFLAEKIPVQIMGVIFNKRSEWYNYLKQYPDIKVPEGY